MATQTPSVRHIEAQHRFEIPFDDGDNAVLEYREVRKGVLDLYHTYTPPARRGQGIAGRLSKAALEHVKEHDLKAVASCWYIRDNYLSDHPEYKPYVVRN
eukprot:TRINITY_DN1070_c0_g1_i1.p1 TRINITY_DN1070_c0_g1~~TRINITY_DN1070_c0_g1_i1.p1  ORF type:complete len:111 (-),score=9.87 TRINITY_DN1070_c0_g1_i1:90-389(-)